MPHINHLTTLDVYYPRIGPDNGLQEYIICLIPIIGASMSLP